MSSLQLRARRSFFVSAAIVAIIAIYCPRVSAQDILKIYGQVVSIKGPIGGILVETADKPYRATTDNQGYFYLYNLPRGHYQLIAHNGSDEIIQTDLIDISQTAPVRRDIFIEPNSMAGPGINVIQSPPYLQKAANFNVRTFSIDPTDSKSLEAAISQIPGLTIVKASATGEKYLSAGGGKSDGVEVLLDGRSINSILTGKADLSQIPLSAITGIEYSASGTDVGTGKHGLGGTVNLTTFRPASSPDELTIAAAHGSYTQEDYLASLNKKLSAADKLKISGEFGYRKNDFDYLDRSGQPQTRQNAASYRKNLYSSFSRNTRRGNLIVSAFYYNGENGVPGQTLSPAENARSKRQTFSGGGIYDHLVSTKLVLSQALSYRAAEYDYTDSSSYSLFDTRYRESEAEYQIKGIYTPHTSMEITALASHNHSELQGTDYIRPDDSLPEHARDLSKLYLALSAGQSLGRVGINCGISQSENFTDKKSYSASNLTSTLKYDSPVEITLSGTIGRSFRLPGLAELNWQEDVFAMPNDNLKPERSDMSSIELSLLARPGGQLRMFVGYSDKTYYDLIYWRRSVGLKYQPNNVARADYFTTSAGLAYNGFNGLLALNYIYERISAINREDNAQYYGKMIIHQPDYRGILKIDVNLRSVTISADMSDTGRRYFLEANTKSLPPYTLVNCGIKYRFKAFRVKTTLSANIDNLTDADYQHLEYQPMPPMSYGFGIKFQL